MRIAEIINEYRTEIQKLGVRTNDLLETIKAVPYRPSDWMIENYPDTGDWREAEVRYNQRRINDLFLIIGELSFRIWTMPIVIQELEANCPNCETRLDGFENQPRYCPECGQAIDWGNLPYQEVE